MEVRLPGRSLRRLVLAAAGLQEALSDAQGAGMGRCRWFGMIFGGCLMLGLVVPMKSIAAEPEAARIDVRGDLLDAEVSGVPLGDVLRAVAEKAGFGSRPGVISGVCGRRASRACRSTKASGGWLATTGST